MTYKSGFLIASVLLAAPGAFAQDEFETLEDYDLKGPVKSVQSEYASVTKKPQDSFQMEYGSEFDEEGNLSGWSFWLSFLDLSSRTTLVRDQEGRAIEMRSHDGDVSYVKTSYTYNSENFLIESKSYYSDGGVEYINTYTYDAAGLLTLKVSSYPESGETVKYIYEYNEEGRLIKSTEDWTYFQESFVYVYDQAGNIIEEHYTSSELVDGESSDYSSYKTYNQSGDWIEATQKNAEGEIVSRESRAFDASGVETHYYNYNSKGKVTAYTVYSEHDQYGNWTESVSYAKKKVTGTESRKIYFY